MITCMYYNPLVIGNSELNLEQELETIDLKMQMPRKHENRFCILYIWFEIRVRLLRLSSIQLHFIGFVL